MDSVKLTFFVLAVFLFVVAVYPSQDSHAFVNNEASSVILGSSDISTSLSLGVNSATHVALDSSGNLWVADSGNNRVIEYKAPLSTGEAATVVLGQPNLSTNTCNDGGISANSLCAPEGLAFDSLGNLWVEDAGNNRVLEYTAPLTTGQSASLVIGQGDFTHNLPDLGSVVNADGLDLPLGLVFDSSGNLWVADADNSRVLEYTAPFSTGQSASLVIGQQDLVSGTCNNSGLAANSLCFPQTLSFDNSGNLWIGDGANNRILKYTAPLTTGQSASLVIGQGDFTHGLQNRGSFTSANTISSPDGISFDSSGNLWVADGNNNRVLKYTAPFSTGQSASTVLGQQDMVSNSTNQGGSVAANTLSLPFGLTFDNSGNLWVADHVNERLLEFTNPFSTGKSASIVIGEPSFTLVAFNSPGLSASKISLPFDEVFDSHGNLWVADGFNNRVLEFVAPFSTGQSASLVLGQSDFIHNLPNQGSSSPAANTLSIPIALAFDSSGNLWVADSNNSRVLEYTAPFSTGQSASLVIGQPDFVHGLINRGGLVSANTLAHITDLLINSGNLWVTDGLNNRIVEYTPPYSNGKAASLVLGQSDFTHNLTNQGGAVAANTLSFPNSAKIDSSGNLWVADGDNNRILEYPSPLSTNEAATVVLGQQSLVHNATNQGGSPSDNTIAGPNYVRFDSSGNLWVADGFNNRVLEFVAPFSTGQSASTVLGQPDFVNNIANTGGISAGTLNDPESINFDALGNIWISDGGNNRVLMDTDFASSTLISVNSISPGSNSFTLGGLTATLTATGTWSDSNIYVEQIDANPQTTNPVGNIIGKFYEIVTNSPDIMSSRSVSLTYTAPQITGPPLLNETSLEISRFNGTWNALSSIVNTGTKTVTASTPGFSTFSLTGFAAPTITSAVGSGSSGFANGAIITVFFSDPTNEPGGTGIQMKSGVDNIFTISKSLGANYTGQWINPTTFRITAVDTAGNGNPDTTGSTTISVNSGAKLRNAAGTSVVSTSSVTLSGNFGKPATPTITNFISDNPSNNSTTYANSNSFTIRFSGSTNQPGGSGVQTKASVDSIFTFSQSLGTDYTGKWANPSTFIITINDATGGTPQIGVTTATVKASANLKDSSGNSASSTSSSPALSGGFGIFTFSTSVASGGSATTTLPSGITAQITLPSTSSGSVSIQETTASSQVSSGSISFLGQKVVDITPPTNSCADGCTFSFTFTKDDLAQAGISLSQVAIFHDRNHDGDFNDPGEVLHTTVTATSDPNQFIATATDDVTSKFAVGGVIAALAILGSENNAPAPPTLSGQMFASGEYPLTINGQGFKLDNYTNSITTSTFQVGKPIDLKLLVYSNLGPDDVGGAALFTNLHGTDLQVSNSNTILAYNNATITITDPDGFTKSVIVSKKPVADKLQLDFVITFANPMDASNLIIRTWTKENYKEDTQIVNAFRVINTVSSQKTNSTLSDLISTNTPEFDVGKTQDSAVDHTSIPIWVKNNAKWWADGKINDKNFLVGLHYLIKNGIITIPQSKSSGMQSEIIPAWVKNNAGFWADGKISDTEFAKGIQYLIDNGIIRPIGNTSHLGVDPLPFR
ncbi:MAG TPA: NHL repeat-containing protein [Candidatus Nitrosotalea sp.]|nr:NHL repeat-containing protein [Candidatus Nitrosotalea sp.]